MTRRSLTASPSSLRPISRSRAASSMTRLVTSCLALLAIAALPLNGSAADPALRFLELRVQQDPLDFTAHNRLAASYIKLMRETGDLAYLDRAAASARASLAAVPASQNVAGLTA